MDTIKIGIIGVGGYAKVHLQSIQYCREKGLCTLKAAVIRDPGKTNYREIEAELKADGVTIYRDYQTLLTGEKGKLDLVSIPGGIDQHEEQSVHALEAGFHVLCEKPAAGTVAEALRMQEAAGSTGKILAIGFQHIFSPSIQKIKALTVEQKLGKLLKAKTYVMWPRDSLYYKRNSWAGKMQINGKWIYDSPIQNATSHFLNNMLYVAGKTRDDSADITAVYGENYMAKENAAPDTQYLRVECSPGILLHHFATHAVSNNVQPVTEYTYEQGKICWQLEYNGKTTVYTKTSGGQYTPVDQFDDGTVPIKDLVFLNTLEAITRQQKPLCHIGNSLAQLYCVSGSFESSGGYVSIDPGYLQRLPVEPDALQPANGATGECNIVIRDIEKTIREMYARETGFYQSGLPWARESKQVKIRMEHITG